MDARIGDWVVTPRHGKAVEINSLWYNALRILSELLRHSGEAAEADEMFRRAERVKDRFREVFWNPRRDCLYDVVAGDHRDPAIRPNQVLAIGLPYPLLGAEEARSVLEVVREELYTPMGLRTLNPGNPDYHRRYEGTAVQRDGAYHQGTVWPWLLGPYVSALLRFGDNGLEEARTVLKAIQPHIAEHGVGSVSEIFDADPPHLPRGCIAQAWSVAELLRAYRQIVEATRRVETASTKVRGGDKEYRGGDREGQEGPHRS
jgi:glycogen debranching enzyme